MLEYITIKCFMLLQQTIEYRTDINARIYNH